MFISNTSDNRIPELVKHIIKTKRQSKKAFLKFDTKACSLSAYAPEESNREGGICSLKYAPDEIKNSIFLPLMEKSNWADAKN